MDDLDRAVINRLQEGLPVCERPFRELAAALGIGEEEVVSRVRRLLDQGTLTRFGPMFDAAAMGGAYTLAAMRVPAEEVERVAALVNRHAEVAHNYERDHPFNMWFVVAVTGGRSTAEVLSAIESESGYPVFDMPKLREYFVRARFAA